MSGDVTVLLKRVRAGEAGAEERLASLVYSQLRKLAASRLRAERGSHTLSPTALANEAWLRFGSEISQQNFENRRHFFGIAATAMRRILVEHARARNAAKRGGGVQPVDLALVDPAAPTDERLVAVDEALTRLAAAKPRAARVVELRFFGGLSHTEIAEVLGLDRRTIDRDWDRAKAWLLQELNP